jgi:CheY-like chemotaxis protein
LLFPPNTIKILILNITYLAILDLCLTKRNFVDNFTYNFFPHLLVFMMKNTVMLVDDSDTDNFIAKSIIEIAGFSNRIIIKNCGLQALDYLGKNAHFIENIPDFLFLDLNMPGMNGFFFLTKFERLTNSIKEKCKIVILTSSTNSTDKDRLEKFSNVVEHFTKPLSLYFLNQLDSRFISGGEKLRIRGSIRF